MDYLKPRAYMRRWWRRLFQDVLAGRTVSKKREELASYRADAWQT